MPTGKKTSNPAARAEIIRRLGQNLAKRRKKLSNTAKTPQNMKRGRVEIQPLQNAFDRFSRGDPLTNLNKKLIRSAVKRTS